MKRMRNKKLAILLIWMLILTLALPGTMLTALAEDTQPVGEEAPMVIAEVAAQEDVNAAGSGSVWTTDITGTQDANVNYTNKQDVLVDAENLAHNAQYFIRVTEPGGTVLGSNSLPVFLTDGSGKDVGNVVIPSGQAYRLWDLVKKASNGTQGYDTSTNGGHEYSVDISLSPDFQSAKNDNFKVFEEPLFGSLEIVKKIGSSDGLPQSGVTFTLVPVGAGKSESGTTNAEGKILFTGLPEGAQYTISETVPAGYSTNLNTATIYTIAANQKITVDVVNTLDVGSLKIVKKKVDRYGMTPVFHVGVPFTLHPVGQGEAIPGTTNGSGEIIFSNLPAGSQYTISETIPAGYETNLDSDHVYTIGKDQTIVVDVLNTKIPDWSITVIKTLETANGEPHAGVTFNLKAWIWGNDPGEGWRWHWHQVATDVTDSNGRIVFDNRYPDVRYHLEEVVPPYFDTDLPVNNEYTLTWREPKATVYVINTHQTASIKVVKTLSQGGFHQGVEFELYEVDGDNLEAQLVDTQTTNANGEALFTGLPVGSKYHLKEVIGDNYYSDLSLNNVIDLTSRGATINVMNTQISTLTVIKTIGRDGPPHQGVTFHLSLEPQIEVDAVSAQNGMMETTSSGGYAVFEGLIVGQTYRLTEDVPDGYRTSLPEAGLLVTIDANGETVRVINTLIPNNLTVIKTIGSLEGPAHQGVEFRMFEVTTPSYVNGPIVGMPAPLMKTTDGLGVALFEGLRVGGTYRLVEIVPFGYSTNLNPDATYYIDGITGVVVRVVNTLNKPAIDIEKSVSSTVVTSGTTVTYTFIVTNIGNTPLMNIEVKDDTIGWSTTIDSMAAGASQKFTQDYTINSWNSGSQFINTVTVTGYDPQQVKVEDTDTATVNQRIITTTTTTTTTVTRDRADPPVTPIPPEPVPLAAPVVAPVILPEEIIPLGVPVLPKTGELPLELFYGLGGILTALGVFLKRK